MPEQSSQSGVGRAKNLYPEISERGMEMGNGRDITMAVKMNRKCFADIEKLARGEPADERQIREILDFIDARYDCADFRMVGVLRSLYSFSGLISAPTLAAMKKTVLNFKYRMDEPGEDSMCYWSENHQLLFATCEYLAGQLYPDETFPNSGMTGEQHRRKGKAAVTLWLRRRFELGMVEWHSNTYYEEDAAPLSLLIDLSRDRELARGAAILMDLLLLDMALHNFHGFFCAASGRCYEAQKKGPLRQDVLDIMEKAFGFGVVRQYDYTRLSAEFILNQKYRMPDAILKIARTSGPMEVRCSTGLDLKEVGSYFSKGRNSMADKGAYLWAMEAFTNPESIQMTMKMFRTYHMRGNDFLKDLRRIDIPFLRYLGLLPPLVRMLHPVTAGIAIQRANTYTYRTENYMLSTAQRYHPGEFGDQQHIWQATLPGGVTVFTTHPGAAFFKDNARNFSPSYWVGNGVNPDAAQIRNVCLCLYRLGVRRGFLEKERQMYTHAWFPFDRFDAVKEAGRLTAGRSGDGYIALFCTEQTERRGRDELIARGAVTGWAVVAGDRAEFGSFENFWRQMCGRQLEKTGRGLRLPAKGAGKGLETVELEYKGRFLVNGSPVATDYPRLDCPFGRVERYPRQIRLRAGDAGLRLDLSAGVRETNEAPED